MSRPVPGLVVEPADPEDEAVPGARLLAWRDARGEVVARGARRGDLAKLRLGAATFRFRLPVENIHVVSNPPMDRSVLEDVAWRTALPLALAASHVPVLHAAAVYQGGGVVGFCATSGTGKSTLATALAQRGARPWADDALALEVGREGVRASPLPFRLRAPAVAGPERYGLSRDEALRARAVPLKSLCILERRSGLSAPGWRRLSATTAFPALLAHAYAFDPNDAREMGALAEACLDVCREVPVYRLRFSPDLQALPELAEEVRSRLLSRRGTIPSS